MSQYDKVKAEKLGWTDKAKLVALKAVCNGLNVKGKLDLDNIERALREGYAKPFHANLIYQMRMNYFLKLEEPKDKRVSDKFLDIAKRIEEKKSTSKDADFVNGEVKPLWKRMFDEAEKELNDKDYKVKF